MNDLEILISLSREYGSDPEMVLAGGGNTSVKADGRLTVKASGHRLGTITEAGFVAMDLARLLSVTEKAYPAGEAEAEAAVLADMMAARLPGETARPSVEALLHALFPQKFVVHLHPCDVNAMTCSVGGRRYLEEHFGGRAVWMDETRPGYTLAMAAKAVMEDFRARTGRPLDLLVMQNHGVFFAADSEDGIRTLIRDFLAAVRAAVDVRADVFDKPADGTAAAEIAAAVSGRGAEGGFATFFSPACLDAFLGLSGGLCAFTPDHIVYCGHAAAVAELKEDPEERLTEVVRAIDDYRARWGVAPKIVAVRGLGAYALGRTLGDALTAKALFLDALKIFGASAAFGGPRWMAPEMVDFIRGWEVERYRSAVAAGKSGGKRLEGKVVIVTGGAQGFGAGLVETVCENGGTAVIADINAEGAARYAAELGEVYGPNAVSSAPCNVSEEASVKELCESVMRRYGRIDVFLSNAGIVRSGSLEEMTAENFALVTKINYFGFFCCAKHASHLMKLETRFDPKLVCDIIQINSKSGLRGSNRNFAYAGSKFGGIGLVQSFAMELAPDRIKVNAICPGNFLNGPLWTDPEKGLFVQYLRAGKVPGAKTVEDIRRAYESKVPMNRGCEIRDVARALLYVIEQEYETGQALPVTGGQAMLN